MVSIGRENLDAAHVARYDAKEFARTTQEAEGAGTPELALLASVGMDADATVVDLGAGTGQFALAIAPSCRRVVAVDPSPVMLARLRAKTAQSGLANVEVVEAGYLSYQHSGAPADVVYSRWALHHLPDFWKVLALRRIRQMLRPGGILRLSDIVFSFEPDEIEGRIEAWCASFPVHPPSDAEWSRADIEEHVRDEHSTFTWVLEPMMERSGFRIEKADYSENRIQADYLARAV